MAFRILGYTQAELVVLNEPHSPSSIQDARFKKVIVLVRIMQYQRCSSTKRGQNESECLYIFLDHAVLFKPIFIVTCRQPPRQTPSYQIHHSQPLLSSVRQPQDTPPTESSPYSRPHAL